MACISPGMLLATSDAYVTERGPYRSLPATNRFQTRAITRTRKARYDGRVVNRFTPAALWRRRVARWAKANATHVSIADVESAAKADVEALAWLDPLLEGKRFAFVGEANHFVHEKLGYRLFVTRYLASRGFGVLLEELAWSDGIRIDRYLESGDSSWLDRVGTFGFEGERRPDRDDRPT